MLGMKRPAAVLLALVTVTTLTGCGKWLPWNKSAATKTPAQVEAPPPEGGPAAGMFPSQDQHLAFTVTDRGKQPIGVEEDLVREGERLVAAQGGAAPYATWLLNADGVWRKDPKGTALLRYLPRTLRDTQAWKQSSDGVDVWFRIARAEKGCALPAGVQAEQCWGLTVLNRGEKTEFLFASGLGPVSADSENWKTPASSFAKKVTAAQPGKLQSAARGKLIAEAPATTATPAPVIPVSDADFVKALETAKPQASGS
jgi:predicted small lipoprotein YifL